MNLSRFISGLRPAFCRNHCLGPPSPFSNAKLETTASFPDVVAQHRRLSSKPPKIDKSRVPEVKEEDIEEKFIRGWGPGGQSINKTSSAVYLRHIPTGITVKCQKHRAQHQNRKEARLLLQVKWDEVLNGEDSVVAQQKRLLEAKSVKRMSKAKKRRQLQAEWKQSLRNDVATDEVGAVSLDHDKDCTDKT